MWGIAQSGLSVPVGPVEQAVPVEQSGPVEQAGQAGQVEGRGGSFYCIQIITGGKMTATFPTASG